MGYDAAGSIINSYSTGAASGNSNVGGLVGYNDNGIIANSYWDTDTSGPNNGLGTGLTDGQMMSLSSFIGWDISDQSGQATVWRIYEGHTYPLLRSFLTPATVTASDAVKTYDGFA